MIHEVNGWEEYDDRWEDHDDTEDEWVLNCGFEGCCMPGYHFRSECHNAEMIEQQESES